MRNRIGRPRFMQSFASAGGGPFLATPPSDGETYGVRNGDTWIEVCEEAPKNGTLYGRISNAWQPIPSGGDPGTASGVLFTPAGNISATNVQAALQELDNEKVAKAGGANAIMTGFLTLHADPDTAMKAATKQYVDTALGNAGVTISDTAPTPNQGKMWWESDTGVLWMSYTDASSTQWIGVGGTTAAISDASKADKTYVDSQDAAITASVAAKADKTYVDTQDALRVLKAGDTMTGDLALRKSSPTLSINSLGATQSGILLLNNDVSKWAFLGLNSGNDLGIIRYDSGGNYLDAPFLISRVTGVIAVAGTTASTSPTTGALTVAGGVGIGGHITIGQNMTAADGYITGAGERTFTIQSTAAGNANLRLRGIGGGVGHVTSDNHLYLNTGPGNAVNVTGTAASTSPTTGALIVAGGVGIGGEAYIGGNVLINKGSPLLAINATSATSVDIKGRRNGLDRWTIRLGDGTAEGGSNAGSDLDIYTHNDAGGAISPVFYMNRATGRVELRSTTASTSPTTGALVVNGGVGIGGVLCLGPVNTGSGVVHVGYNNNTVGSAINTRPQVSGTAWPVNFENSAGGTVGHISITDSSCSFNNVSDIRGKPNREPLSLDTARNIIDALEVYDFDKDGNAIRGIGLVAQQAHGVHKSLASPGRTDADYWMAEKAAPMPFVIANVQQLNKRLDALERRLRV